MPHLSCARDLIFPPRGTHVTKSMFSEEDKKKVYDAILVLVDISKKCGSSSSSPLSSSARPHVDFGQSGSCQSHQSGSIGASQLSGE